MKNECIYAFPIHRSSRLFNQDTQVQFSNLSCGSKTLGHTEGQTHIHTHSGVYRVAPATKNEHFPNNKSV